MPLLDLPLETFQHILDLAIEDSKLQAIAELRLVSRKHS
jgi:hypothetical protein